MHFSNIVLPVLMLTTLGCLSTNHGGDAYWLQNISSPHCLTLGRRDRWILGVLFISVPEKKKRQIPAKNTLQKIASSKQVRMFTLFGFHNM